MKKISSIVIVSLIVLSTFSMLAPQTKAELEILRAWKDDTSLGLENDHLLLHGSAVAGNYLWFFDYLIFKDTGTMWYQPWDELAIIVYPVGSLGPWTVGADYEITASTEADRAYLIYSVTKDNLKQDVTYTIYPSEPYIHISFSITNIGSTMENTWAGVQFTTWIAGDYANDYYYVPGYGERQFTGGTNDIHYTDATGTWAATWDKNKEEGAGILSTQGFAPSNIMSIDWGVGEGFRFSSDSFNLDPGQSSATFDCYLSFFTGTGYEKVKDFYDEKCVHAWKDEDSFGLENSHLKLEGDYSHYNHGMPWFNYLLFKDTETTWTSPWDDIFVLYLPRIFSADPGTVVIEAFNFGDEAKLTYSCDIPTPPPPCPPVHVDLTISIRDDSYFLWTAQVTNIGSSTAQVPISLTLYTFIAGDTANDYYYVPGHGQGQFIGTQENLYYQPTENWVAVWDEAKSEGCGIINTQGFGDVQVAISDWYAITAVPEMASLQETNGITLAPGEASEVYDCYYYFYEGTGWKKTKDFYDSAHALPAIPVGGYSFPIKDYAIEKPLTLYLALIGILTVSFTIAKRRKKQQS